MFDRYSDGMKKLTHYKTIIFDLDGTLFDTWPSLFQAVRNVVPTAEAIEPEALRLALSQGIEPMFKQAVRQMQLDINASQTVLQAMHNEYFDHVLLSAVPYKNTHQMLSQLHLAGFTLGLCTNRDRASTLALLDCVGWQSLFSQIHCLDDGLPAKPDPTSLLAILARLDCTPSQTLFVGDSHIDALCAAQAGIDFAAHQCGYHTHPDDLIPAVLSYYNMIELTQWLTDQSVFVSEIDHD